MKTNTLLIAVVVLATSLGSSLFASDPAGIKSIGGDGDLSTYAVRRAAKVLKKSDLGAGYTVIIDFTRGLDTTGSELVWFSATVKLVKNGRTIAQSVQYEVNSNTSPLGYLRTAEDLGQGIGRWAVKAAK